MFSEPRVSSVVSSSPVVISTPTSPLSSRSVSPLSSTPHSRTSTITSASVARTDISTSSHAFSTLNYSHDDPQQPQPAAAASTQHRQMKIGKYFLERTIGKGNFAVVKLATHRDTHQKVAIKIIDKSRLDPADHKKLEREISVMKSLIHPFIIRLYEVMESKNLIYLVTEYAPNGELLDLLIREKRLSEAKAKEKFRQLVLAVEYIHAKNIVHRDLKAENLLLDSHGNIKVADFGFANVFKPDSTLQTFCGSPPYAAPELYQCLPYSPDKVDVWSLGVLLYVFVCGRLPFDSNNLAELRKRVLAGQFRLPFFISADCSSLISHMLTIDPVQRYTIGEVKKHPWLQLNSSQPTDASTPAPSIPNSHLTNAILDHAESLGYNRKQILKSVNGNSYDSDAAIWHLLLEKFQQTCQIDSSHIPVGPTLHDDINSSDLARRSTAPIIYDQSNRELLFLAPNTAESIRPQLDPCDLQYGTSQEFYHRLEPEIRIDYPEQFDDVNSDDDGDDDELTSAQSLEQYTRTRGLRRHTIGRPDLMIHGGPIPSLASKVRFAHQLSTIEPALLSNRLTHLQHQRQHSHHIAPTAPTQHNHQSCSHTPLSQDYQRNPHSASFNGLFAPSTMNNTPLDAAYPPPSENHWLTPPVLNNFNMNRRASDSGAHLLLFQQQHGVTGSNTFGAVRPTHAQSPSSNRSSRGSITRGMPITPPTFSITPHETGEEDNEGPDDEYAQSLARYLNQGKRHTVCEQGLLLGGKARRGGGGGGSGGGGATGTRESVKERSLASRRSSDTSSSFTNNSTRAHLERLFHNAVNAKASDDDLTASSLQELQKLQKQVQKYPASTADSSMIRRAAAVPSPTNLAGLHMIQEEHQRNPRPFSSVQFSNQNRGSSSSSEALADIDDEDNEMDCDVDPPPRYVQPDYRQPPGQALFRPPFYQPAPSSFCCPTNPLPTQHLAIPTTTSSYMP